MRVASTRGKRRVVSLLLVLLLAHLLLLLLLRRDQPASSPPPPPAAAAAAAADAPAAAAPLPPALGTSLGCGGTASSRLHRLSVDNGVPRLRASPCVGVASGRPWAWQPLYIVVIDAGATATRAHVFSFLRCCVDNTFMLQKEDYFHVDDSILHYVNAPLQVRSLVVPLVRQAKTVVPQEYVKYTPLILRATPSLRRLPRLHATRLIHRARNIASRTAFLVKRDHVTIMAGSDEAADLWLAANFLTGRLYQNGSLPLATADLGGGTLQVTVPLPGPPDHIRRAIERRKQRENNINTSVNSSESRQANDDVIRHVNNSYQKNRHREPPIEVGSGFFELDNRGESENRRKKSRKRQRQRSDEDESEGDGARKGHSDRREEGREHREPAVSRTDVARNVHREVLVAPEEAAQSETHTSSSGTKAHSHEANRDEGSGGGTEGSDGLQDNEDRRHLNGITTEKHLVNSDRVPQKTNRGGGGEEEIRRGSEADTSSLLEVSENDVPARLTPDFPGKGRAPEDEVAKGGDEEQEGSLRKEARQAQYERREGDDGDQDDNRRERKRQRQQNTRGGAEGKRQQEEEAENREGSKGEQRKESSSPTETSTKISQRETSTQGSRVAAQDTGALSSPDQRFNSNDRTRSSGLNPRVRPPSSETHILRPLIQRRKRRKQRRRQRKRNQKKPTRRKDVSNASNATSSSPSAERDLKDLHDLDGEQLPVTALPTPPTIQEVLPDNPQEVRTGSGEDEHVSDEISLTHSRETSVAPIGDPPWRDNHDYNSQRTIESSRIRGEDNERNRMKSQRVGKSQAENRASSEMESSTSEPSREFKGNEVIIREAPETADKARESEAGGADVRRHEQASSQGEVMEVNQTNGAAQEETEEISASGAAVRREETKSKDIEHKRKMAEDNNAGEEKRRYGIRRYRPANSRSGTRIQRRGKSTSRRRARRLQGLEPSASLNSTHFRVALHASTRLVTETVTMQKPSGTRQRLVTRGWKGGHGSRGADADDSIMSNQQNSPRKGPRPTGTGARPAGSQASERMESKKQSRFITREDRKRQTKITSPIQQKVGKERDQSPQETSAELSISDKESADGVRNLGQSSEYPERRKTLLPSPRQRHHRRPHRRRQRVEGRRRRTSGRAQQNVLHGRRRFSSSDEDKGSAARREEDQRNREELAVLSRVSGQGQEPPNGSYFVGRLPGSPSQARRLFKVTRDLRRSPGRRPRETEANTRLKHILAHRNKCKTKVVESRNKASRRPRESGGWKHVSTSVRKTKDDLKTKRRKVLALTQRHPGIKRELRTSDERGTDCHRTVRQTRELEADSTDCRHSRSHASRSSLVELLVVNMENFTEFPEQENETVVVNIPSSAGAQESTDQRTRRELRNLFDAPNITFRCSPSHKYWLFASSVSMGIYPARVQVLQAGRIIRLPSGPGERSGSGSVQPSPSPAPPRHRSDIPPEEEYTELDEDGETRPQSHLPPTPTARPLGPTSSSSSSPHSTTSSSSSSSSPSPLPPPLPPPLRPPHTQVITNKWMEETLAKVKTVVDSILRSIGSARAEQERKQHGRRRKVNVSRQGRRRGGGGEGEKEAPHEGEGEVGGRRRIMGRTGSRRRKTDSTERDGGRRERDPSAGEGRKEEEERRRAGSSGRRDRSGVHRNERDKPEMSHSQEAAGASGASPDAGDREGQSPRGTAHKNSSGSATDSASDSYSRFESAGGSGSENDGVSRFESHDGSRYESVSGFSSESDGVSISENGGVSIYYEDIGSYSDSISRTIVQSASLAKKGINSSHLNIVASGSSNGGPLDKIELSSNSEIAPNSDSEKTASSSNETPTSSYDNTDSSSHNQGFRSSAAARSPSVSTVRATDVGSDAAENSSRNSTNTSNHKTSPRGIDAVPRDDRFGTSSKQTISSVTDLLFTVPNERVIKPAENSEVKSEIRSTEALIRTSLEDLLFRAPGGSSRQPHEERRLEAGDARSRPNVTKDAPPSGAPKLHDSSTSDDSLARVTTEENVHSFGDKTTESEETETDGSATTSRTDSATGAVYPAMDVENGMPSYTTENGVSWGNSLGERNDLILRTTCLPIGSMGRFKVEDETYLVIGMGPGKGAQDCWKEVTDVVKKHIRLPTLKHTTLLATTAFYFVAANANLIEPDMDYGLVRVGQFRVAANTMCATEPRLLPDPLACLDYQYIAALLTHGLHLQDDTEILVCEKIQGFRLGWALGAALDYLQNH